VAHRVPLSSCGHTHTHTHITLSVLFSLKRNHSSHCFFFKVTNFRKILFICFYDMIFSQMISIAIVCVVVSELLRTLHLDSLVLEKSRYRPSSGSTATSSSRGGTANPPRAIIKLVFRGGLLNQQQTAPTPPPPAPPSCTLRSDVNVLYTAVSFGKTFPIL